MIHHGLELRSSHIAGSGSNNAKGGASTQKGPGSDKKALKEQQMRAREKMLINNGGTVLGSHSMPHAMMNLHQQMKPVQPPSGITGSLGGSIAYGSETGGSGG